jgi:C1A family cysteine protease
MVIGGLVYTLSSPDLYLSFRFLVNDEENKNAVNPFTQFMKEYTKKYESVEEQSKRERIFSANLKKIQAYNAQPHRTVTLGINKFADLTDEEFHSQFLSKSVNPGPELESTIKASPNPDLKVNWVEKGKVSGIKDQGNCGSCWTFSSISVVETIYAIRNEGIPERYSEQMLVDCCISNTSQGCNGGEEYEALTYIRDKGIAAEFNYPYKARDEDCKADKMAKKFKIDGYVHLNKGNNSEMERVIQTRSLSVALNAGNFVFRFYKSGVIETGCPSDDLNHAVTVVGANTENGKPYWLVRNSWGQNWGQSGYLKIARSDDGKPGVCGISSSVHYPLYKEK